MLKFPGISNERIIIEPYESMIHILCKKKCRSSTVQELHGEKLLVGIIIEFDSYAKL